MSYQIVRFVAPGRYLVNFKRNIHIQRILCGTHYDTLKLPRNCTSKEVRESFIKLSKQCHPDRNRGDPNTHAKFVKLNEAYSVLSRPEKRHEYDLSIRPATSERYHRPSERSPFDVYSTAYRQRVVWRDESFWEYKDKNTHGDYNQSGDYYGIKGIKRVPNGWIAILCVVFAALGVWIQVLLIKYSTAFNRHAIDERSQETGKMLSDVQDRAMRHGNKRQLELMKKQMSKKQNSSEENDSPVTGDETVVIPGAEYYSRPSLGYLGDMPHKIGNDIEPMPELHDLTTNSGLQNDVSNEILTKPVTFSTANTRNEDILRSPLLYNLSGK